MNNQFQRFGVPGYGGQGQSVAGLAWMGNRRLGMEAAATQLQGSFSGGGYGGGMPGGSCFSIDICPDLILALITAAAAAAALGLYLLIVGAGKRRKRSASDEEFIMEWIVLSWAPQLATFFNLGSFIPFA